jgi:formate-dependent nitrite reductase cytochrome c552 subunit
MSKTEMSKTMMSKTRMSKTRMSKLMTHGKNRWEKVSHEVKIKDVRKLDKGRTEKGMSI